MPAINCFLTNKHNKLPAFPRLKKRNSYNGEFLFLLQKIYSIVEDVKSGAEEDTKLLGH